MNGVRDHFGGSDHIKEFADELDIPPMAVELLIARGTHSLGQFERIDELTT